MKYYSITEVADMLSLHRNTIISWIDNGKIKATQLGKVWRISEEEIKRIIEKGKKANG